MFLNRGSLGVHSSFISCYIVVGVPGWKPSFFFGMLCPFTGGTLKNLGTLVELYRVIETTYCRSGALWWPEWGGKGCSHAVRYEYEGA